MSYKDKHRESNLCPLWLLIDYILTLLSIIYLQVYLADFGLARKYVMEGAHKAYKEEPAKAHDGTKEFTSIDAHKGFFWSFSVGSSGFS